MKYGFYTKLAFTNIRKNRRIYVPYVFTCILTVMMYYLVRSLSVNPGLKEMYGGYSIASTLRLGTFVIGVFALIFLFYTNSFLMKRRQKEFGVFNILGMEKKHLARMILTETVLVTVISLGLGLGSGILFDKVMFLLICKLVGAEISLGFFVSGGVILSTVKLFCGIYLIIYLRAVYTVQVNDPIELLRGSSTGEREPKTKGLLALAGAVCLGTGYGIIFYGGDSGDHRNLSGIYGRQHCNPEASPQKPEVLLPAQAFYQRIRHDIPDEAECGGACKYLHPVYHGAGDALVYYFPDTWQGGYDTRTLPQ